MMRIVLLVYYEKRFHIMLPAKKQLDLFVNGVKKETKVSLVLLVT